MLAEDPLQEGVRSWLILTRNGWVAAAVEVGNVIRCFEVAILVLPLFLAHRELLLGVCSVVLFELLQVVDNDESSCRR